MVKKSRLRLPATLVCALVVTTLATTATADEIWVAPGTKPGHFGDWAVTRDGKARFSFVVPDNMKSFQAAKVVVIGKKNAQFTYNLHLSVSQDMSPHNYMTYSDVGLRASVRRGELLEIDVSHLLPSLEPGVDLVSLQFLAKPRWRGKWSKNSARAATGWKGDDGKDGDHWPTGHVRVVGLRFLYEPFEPLAGLSCDPNEVLMGFDEEGTGLVCISREALLNGLTCPPGEVLFQFGPAGPVCITPQELLAGLGCATDEVLLGYDEKGAVCGPREALLAGLTCPDKEQDGNLVPTVLTGFDTSGVICKSLTDLSAGGGGPPPQEPDFPTFSIDDVSLKEGNSGKKDFEFTVTLAVPNDYPCSSASVRYATQDGTAVDLIDPDRPELGGDDYDEAHDQLSFSCTNGEVQKFTVSVNGDTIVEPNEFFKVLLSEPTCTPAGSCQAIISDREGRGTIENDDPDQGR